MKRLREEIASVMDGNLTPTRDQIKKMPYLACVIKESESSSSLIPTEQVTHLTPQAFASILRFH